MDPVRLLFNALFALILLVPFAALLAGVVALVSTVPFVLALFPMTLSIFALFTAVFYWRWRKEKRRRAQEKPSSQA